VQNVSSILHFTNCVYLPIYDLFHILLSLWQTYQSMECVCVCDSDMLLNTLRTQCCISIEQWLHKHVTVLLWYIAYIVLLWWCQHQTL